MARVGQRQQHAAERSRGRGKDLFNAVDRPDDRVPWIKRRQVARICRAVEQDLPRQAEERPQALILRIEQDADSQAFGGITTGATSPLLIQVANPPLNQRVEQRRTQLLPGLLRTSLFELQKFPGLSWTALLELPKVPGVRQVELERLARGLGASLG